MTTVSVHDVVALLLRHASGHLSISAIHKMSYYVQGYHLAWAGTPLFDEVIEARSTGPVVPALYPFHEKNPYTATAWPAGNAGAVGADAALVVKAIFADYGHLSGLIMGNNAKQEAPYLLAKSRATDADPHQVIDLAELKAFFKALDDAPAGRVEYANRFMGNYTDPTEPTEPPPVQHTLIGPHYATASLPDDDHAGWYWKCSCGAKASPWIQNWPESKDEAREEWHLHFK